MEDMGHNSSPWLSHWESCLLKNILSLNALKQQSSSISLI